jgi:hypothetical protein
VWCTSESGDNVVLCLSRERACLSNSSAGHIVMLARELERQLQLRCLPLVFSSIDSCPVHLFVISSSAKCLHVSKTESYGISRICFEMTQQATMPSSSEKCLRVSKTESYGLSRICFEMTRQATVPSSKA